MADRVKPPALDSATVAARIGAGFPAPFDQPCRERQKRVLGDPLGLTQFGVNLATLPPGAWSSQRHWHEQEDEFVYVLEGEVVLITESGEQVLSAGMAAGFPAGVEDGHHMINRSDKPVRYLEVGTRAPQERCVFPDVDMTEEIDLDRVTFLHKDGAPY